MFFIFGTPRSGTTLLAQCLNANSRIVVPHETDFIIPMAFIIDRIADEQIGRELVYKMIVNSTGYAASLGEFLAPSSVHDAIQSCNYSAACILEALYAKIASASGATLAGDKSPNDLNFLRILVKAGGLTPAMKIIHIVRDVRDVMLSVNDAGWVSNLDAYFPRFWCSSNLYLQSIYAESANYTLLKYEDLVSRPECEISRLCQFLDVDFEEGMLAPEKRHQRYRGVSAHQKLYNPISDSSVGKHKAMLNESSLRKYETQALEALVAFGYM